MCSRVRVGAALLAPLCMLAAQSQAQCQLLARDSFRTGPRPHGNGRPRDANVHDSLKDYWPQTPDNTRWLANDQTGVPTWAFAASSLDPAEVDPLDPYNGTAFGEAPAAALLPFAPPGTAVTISAEVVMLQLSTSAAYLGFTSDPVLLSNFESFGSLWVSLNGRGDWAIRANGAQLVASGQAPLAGTLASGWLHVELTYDPAGSTVSGLVMGVAIPPTPVTLTLPIRYVGMEAHESWNVVNNFSVVTGPALGVSVAGPATVCAGSTVVLSSATNASPPAGVFWTRNGTVLADGPQPSGSTVSGATTTTLRMDHCTGADAGDFECVVTNNCGLRSSGTHTLGLGNCCPADVDDGTGSGTPDGGVTIDDLLYYLRVFDLGLARADLDDGSGLGHPDGGVTIDDLLFYLVRFDGGC